MEWGGETESCRSAKKCAHMCETVNTHVHISTPTKTGRGGRGEDVGRKVSI
jgi:hypothetical protein